MRERASYLGLSPGTHKMGIVLYYNGEFMDWRLRTFPGNWNTEKMESILAIIEKQFERYGPTVVALKVSNGESTSKAMEQILQGVKTLAAKKKIRLYMYTFEEMKLYCSTEKKFTMKSFIAYMAEAYPDFQLEHKRATRTGNAYERIFEAAGAILLCLHEDK